MRKMNKAVKITNTNKRRNDVFSLMVAERAAGREEQVRRCHKTLHILENTLERLKRGENVE